MREWRKARFPSQRQERKLATIVLEHAEHRNTSNKRSLPGMISLITTWSESDENNRAISPMTLIRRSTIEIVWRTSFDWFHKETNGELFGHRQTRFVSFFDRQHALKVDNC